MSRVHASEEEHGQDVWIIEGFSYQRRITLKMYSPVFQVLPLSPYYPRQDFYKLYFCPLPFELLPVFFQDYSSFPFHGLFPPKRGTTRLSVYLHPSPLAVSKSSYSLNDLVFLISSSCVSVGVKSQ